jgi:hypothetical protein
MTKQSTSVLLAACLVASVALGGGEEKAMGIALEAGIAGSQDTGSSVLSLSGVLIFLNGSIDYVDPWSSDADRESAFRGYLGLGIGPLIQLQAGYGTDDVLSGRLKTTWTFRELKKGNPGFGYAGGDSWLGFSSPDGWLTRGGTVTVFAEYREDDELSAGIQFGMMIW